MLFKTVKTFETALKKDEFKSFLIKNGVRFRTAKFKVSEISDNVLKLTPDEFRVRSTWVVEATAKITENENGCIVDVEFSFIKVTRIILYIFCALELLIQTVILISSINQKSVQPITFLPLTFPVFTVLLWFLMFKLFVSVFFRKLKHQMR